MTKKAIILLSGGIDSTVNLAIAIDRGLDCYAISFDYEQRHRVELKSAAAICTHYGVEQRVIKIDPSSFAGSSLVDHNVDVPTSRKGSDILEGGIPNTYVPARNTLFLSYAVGFAETLNADEIHVGMNAMDRGAYPDCRPEFVVAFQNLINVATKQSVEQTPPQLITPLLELNKAEIIALGMELNAPLELTHTCYSPTSSGLQCGVCDACHLRAEGFEEALRIKAD